jgi:hypothetical protein
MPLVAERRGSVEGGRICSGRFSDLPILVTIASQGKPQRKTLYLEPRAANGEALYVANFKN